MHIYKINDNVASYIASAIIIQFMLYYFKTSLCIVMIYESYFHAQSGYRHN
jgi:hypothetical protein